MTILVTGAAGFIGYHVSAALLARGGQVIGVDNLNDYYNVALKKDRLKALQSAAQSHDGFTFIKENIANHAALNAALKPHIASISHIIHLAAEAGERYTLEKPYAYAESKLTGHFSILELARHTPNLQHLVYASSSSVYGTNSNVPFSITDRTDHPVSLYAATKRSDELMSEAYHHLYAVPMTGLRFFTVYGPYGRPDMAYFLFTKAILEEQPIVLFNEGKLQRDFTYIDDIVNGVIAAKDHTPTTHQCYNLGNNQPVELLEFVSTLEKLLGKEALKRYEPMQPGDVFTTYADITESSKELGFVPRTQLVDGLTMFVHWYKSYYNAA